RTRYDYDPRALREWSSGALPPVASRLHELTIPTLWIAGARDAKYAAEAKRAAALAANGRVAIVADAGHRVPWERPVEFIEILR
ncbi:MAG TPA: alpha/beta hydrolase, partial [Thermoanaerobaculia bacterium]|nr:alpha/beta hydrolase [Thermoanaerobaculia bacterium]